MIKKFIFDGNEYLTEKAVRQAIWEKKRMAFPTPVDAEGWAKLGVTYVEEEESIATLQNRKIFSVKQAFLNWRKKATLKSSLGFKIDSNERAKDDIEGLLALHEKSQESPIVFRDADNQFHELTYGQLQTLKLEVMANGAFAYEQKWALEMQIERAQSKSELDAIVIVFEGKQF